MNIDLKFLFDKRSILLVRFYPNQFIFFTDAVFIA